MPRVENDAAGWRQLNALLDQALDQPPAARHDWLRDLNPQFDAFKPQLRDLLSRAAEIETGEWLETLPKLGFLAESMPATDTRQAGELIGPYRLIRVLGFGGMGSVWLAQREDGLFNRPVALKLPHLLSPRVGLAERMARERQFLATLDHPKIAKLLDAGLNAAGQPYLALEFVAGRTIDAHCLGADGSAPLTLRQRLRLFLQVVEAVAHAHGKLVLHRDLKPANVLVTTDGQVRLLDFGVAKLLDDGEGRETRLTELSGRALTPDYASPEQILGEPLTVASDVYSLGVILYELLTGTRPYRIKGGSRRALEEAILGTDAQRPSTVVTPLRKEMRGDLDTVVLKALKKNPAERYATAHALADDVKRWLESRPVLAQPDSLGYRVRKFVRRNRLAVGSFAAVTLAVVGGAGIAVTQMLAAREQRDAAMLHQRRAEAFSQFMGVILHDAGGGARPLTATALLDRGVTMLENQRGMDDAVMAYMWYEISRSYRIFSQTDRERALLERGAAGARRIGDASLLAASQCALAWSSVERGRSSAEAQLIVARAALASLSNPADYAQVECVRAESRMRQVEGDVHGAIALIEAARPQIGTLRQGQGWNYALLMDQLAGLYRAVDRNKDSLAISQELLGRLRDNGRRGSLAEMMLMSSYGRDLCRVGEYAACAAIHEDVLERFSRADMSHLPPVGIHFRAGVAAYNLGQHARALDMAAVELNVAGRSGNPAALANAHMLTAYALLGLDRLDEALAAMARAEQIWSANPGAFTPNLRDAAIYRIELLLARGDVAGARRAAQTLLEKLGYPARLQSIPDRLLRLAAAIELRGDDVMLAERIAGEALRQAEHNARSAHSSADVGRAASLRAQARQKLDRAPDARKDAELAVLSFQQGFGAGHAETRRAEALLAALQPNS